MTDPHGSSPLAAPLNVEQAVRDRYSAASQQQQAALCCPVDYNARYLEVLPQELIERDYGCGDPSRHVSEGETVLDLGSGGGKICYIASQVVGPTGRVIGVDMNDDMLALARRFQEEIGQRIGYHNVEFHKGRIQDLALDLEQFEQHLAQTPIRSVNDWLAAQATADWLRAARPMIAADSIDVVVSNCVLNLVREEDRRQLFREIVRVLRPGGRAVISDIVSDQPAPEHLRNDPELWSGCLSGAWVEEAFLREFERAGLHGIQIVSRQQEPWAVVEGIEFRSLSVAAYKGTEGLGRDLGQAVIYKGPWKSVAGDDGCVLRRGVRTAVCQNSFDRYSRPPYQNEIIALEPAVKSAADDAAEFACESGAVRDPREMKSGIAPRNELPAGDCCSKNDCC